MPAAHDCQTFSDQRGSILIMLSTTRSSRRRYSLTCSSGGLYMGEVLTARRTETQSRLAKLKAHLGASAPRAEGKACIYITGSFGRGEASAHSDLDLFIVGLGTRNNRALPRLEEICIKADLIQATRDLHFPEFSGDGEYLEHYTEDELIGTLGQPEDDANNTFTARLLMLLESQAVVGVSVYERVVKNVVAAYWRDYEDHKNEFIPAFLANDILRLWRTFCVNYEARTETDPPEKKAKRKIKNYKLKHSRLLTCYSALLYLLAVFARDKTVSPTDAVNMIALTPTGRLEWLATQSHTSEAHSSVISLLGCYEE